MKTFLLALFAFVSTTVFAQDEMLDNTFGDFGSGRLLDGAMPGLSANCIAFQESTNRIFVGGGGWASTAQVQSFIVANYVFLGAIDQGFGTGGFAHADFGFVGAEVTCMHLQTDGKIVVAGTVGVGANKHFGVARFLANGQLDSTFANNGTTIINFGYGNETPLEITVLLDGKILVAGNLNDASFGVARLTANGTLDNLFGGDGTIDSDLPNNQPLTDIAFTAEGKIYATSSVLNQGNHDFVVLKYASNGSPDQGFGTNGMLTVDINQTDDFAKAIAIQPGGKIIIAGETSLSTKSIFVARYTQFGTVDPLFGNTGITTSVTNSTVKDVTMQPDGKVVIGGTLTLTQGNPYNYMVARYTSDGTADNTFGGDGMVNTDFNDFDNTLGAVCVQPDGRTLAVGKTEYDFWTGATAITLCRYLPSLTIGIVVFETYNQPPLLYPNPLQNTERLKYTLASDDQISIVLLDGHGKLVATFVENEKQVKGDHEVELNLPNGLPNGNYFIQIASPKGKISIKAIK